MADIQHVSIQHADCHEPRHITIASTTDSGKVITPSSSTAGTSVLRYLTASDIDFSSIPAGQTLVSNGAGGVAGVTSGSVIASTTVSNVVADSAGSGAYTKISFNSIDYSSDSAGNPWVLSSNSLTVPEDGWYKITFSCSITSGVSNVQPEDNPQARVYAVAGTGTPSDARAFSVDHVTSRDVIINQSAPGVCTQVSGSYIAELTSQDPVSVWLKFVPYLDVADTRVARANLLVEKVG